MMRVLVACEELQRVCIAFREKGFDAYSCDLRDCSGGHPEWHIKDDCLRVMTEDYFDLVIAHPPCTRLCVSGQRWYYTDDLEYNQRKRQEQKEAIDFFMKIVRYADCGNLLAIENPIGIMSKLYRRPDQIYNPCDFAFETEAKRTCLWLFNGLQPLDHTQYLQREFRTHNIHSGYNGKKYLPYSSDEMSVFRSKTPVGVARAMAEQWGAYLERGY